MTRVISNVNGRIELSSDLARSQANSALHDALVAAERLARMTTKTKPNVRAGTRAELLRANLRLLLSHSIDWNDEQRARGEALIGRIRAELDALARVGADAYEEASHEA